MVLRAIRWIDRNLEDRIILLLYFVMVVMLFVEVVKRYVFHVSSPYANEIATYMFLWIVFLGMPYGIKLRSHIVIDVLPRRSPLVEMVLELIANAITAPWTTRSGGCWKRSGGSDWSGIRSSFSRPTTGTCAADTG